ncbi:hypothetical protein DYB28_013381, partial [Aphanomyces astaci]
VMEHDIVFITEANIGEYSIEDVVLPVHGYNTLLPKNEIAAVRGPKCICRCIPMHGVILDMLEQIYERCAKEDGVDFASLKRNQSPEYNLPGSYRHIVCKPKAVAHTIKRYNDETIPLVESDVDRLMKRTAPPSIPDGRFRSICLDFILRTNMNIYATIAIRELLKQSSSIHVQLGLNEQGAGQAMDTTSKANTAKSIPIGRPGFSLSSK